MWSKQKGPIPAPCRRFSCSQMDRSYSHSRARAKSASVLPCYPELDINRRRSGIRHFSHVPSIKVAQTKQKRSVTKPMRWKNWFRAGMADLYVPKRQGQGVVRQPDLGRLAGDPRRVMAGGPPLPGEGTGLMLTPTSQQPLPRRRPLAMPATAPMYPYPLHIPAAAAVAPASRQPQQQQVPQPQQQNMHAQVAESHRATPMDTIVSITSGIGCTVGLLFIWIFRYEVATFGILFGVLAMLWMAGRWYSQISVLTREQELMNEGRLHPGQVQPQQQQQLRQREQEQQRHRAFHRYEQQQREEEQRQNRAAGLYQQQQEREQQQEQRRYGPGPHDQRQPQQQRYVIVPGPFLGTPVPGAR